MSAAQIAVDAIDRLVVALLHEARELLDNLAPLESWLDRVKRLAELDLQAEIFSATAPLRRKADDSVHRAVADVASSVEQLRGFAPDFDREWTNNGRVVRLVPSPRSSDRLALLRAEARGRIQRLAAVTGAGVPAEAPDAPSLTPTQTAILAEIGSAPVAGWKGLIGHLKRKGSLLSQYTVRMNGLTLVREGYVEWKKDGKAKHLHITPAGRNALARKVGR